MNASEEIALYKSGTPVRETNVTVKVDDGFTLIEDEEDFWAIYTDTTTLAGSYRLADDLTLSKSSVEMFGYEVNETFTGILDGDGHTLTWNVGAASGARLFYSVTGTIRNINLNAGQGFYWGSAVAFSMSGATVKDVTVTATFVNASTNQQVPGEGENPSWTLGAAGCGGLAVWVNNCTVENCTINLTLSGDATAAYYAGIAYDIAGSTLTNVTVKCATQLDLYKTSTPASETNVNFELITA